MTMLWAITWYLTDWLLNHIVIFWKLLYLGCLQVCLYFCGRGYSFSILWGRRTAMAECDICRKLKWITMDNCMSSSVNRPNSNWFYSWGDTWRSILM
jgi:hypothetical protein